MLPTSRVLGPVIVVLTGPGVVGDEDPAFAGAFGECQASVWTSCRWRRGLCLWASASAGPDAGHCSAPTARAARGGIGGSKPPWSSGLVAGRTWSAIDPPLHVGGVALALDIDLVGRRGDLREVFGSDSTSTASEFSCRRWARGAGDGHDPLVLGQQPGSATCAVVPPLRGDRRQQVDEGLVGAPGLLGEPRQRVAQVGSLKDVVLSIAPVRKPLPSGLNGLNPIPRSASSGRIKLPVLATIGSTRSAVR